MRPYLRFSWAILASACAPALTPSTNGDAEQLAHDARIDGGASDAELTRDADILGAEDSGTDDRLRYLESCQLHAHDCASRDAGPKCGQCQLRTVFDTTRCTRARPCDRLFLLWAAMSCDSDEAGAVLRDVAARPGWVAACVQPLFPGEMLPTTLGAPEREDEAITSLFDTLKVDTGVWSGRELLMGGCSAGATRYPVVAARTTGDARWLGTAKNAACFSDGVFDIPAQDQFTGEGVAMGGATCAARHQRMATAFTTTTARPGHGCSESPGGQCACDPSHATRSWPSSCGDGDCLAYESIVVAPAGGGAAAVTFAAGVDSSSFAITSWKLVSEGSDFASTPDRCTRDVVPEAPLAGLCALLDADPDRACSLRTFPAAPHCSTYWRSLSVECLDWFEGL